MQTSTQSQVNSLGQEIESKVLAQQRVSAGSNLTSLESIDTIIKFDENNQPKILYKFKLDPIVIQDIREMLPKDKINEISDESIKNYIKNVQVENPLDLIRLIQEKEGRFLHPNFIEIHSNILDNLERDFSRQNVLQLKSLIVDTNINLPTIDRFNQGIIKTIQSKKPINQKLEEILDSTIKFEKYQKIETATQTKNISANKLLRQIHIPEFHKENEYSIFRSNQFRQYSLTLFDMFIPQKRDHFAKTLINFYENLESALLNDISLQNFAHTGFKSMNQWRQKNKLLIDLFDTFESEFQENSKTTNYNIEDLIPVVELSTLLKIANKSKYDNEEFSKDLMQTFLSYKLAKLTESEGIYSNFKEHILNDEFNLKEYDSQAASDFISLMRKRISPRSLNVLEKIFEPKKELIEESENQMFEMISTIEHVFQHYTNHLQKDTKYTVGYNKATSSLNLLESEIPIHAGKIKPMLYRTSGGLVNTHTESSFSHYLKNHHIATVNGRQKRTTSQFKDFKNELKTKFAYLTQLDNCIPAENALVAESRENQHLIDKEFYGTKLRNKKVNYKLPKIIESKRNEINYANFAIAHAMNASIPIAHKAYFSNWHTPLLEQIYNFYINMKFILPEQYRIGENNGMSLFEAVSDGELKRDRNILWKIGDSGQITCYEQPINTKLEDKDYIINPDGSTSIIRIIESKENFVIYGPEKVTHVDDNLDVYCSTSNKIIGNLNCFIDFAKGMYQQNPNQQSKAIVQGLNFMKSAHKGLRKLAINEGL